MPAEEHVVPPKKQRTFVGGPYDKRTADINETQTKLRHPDHFKEWYELRADGQMHWTSLKPKRRR
jgi:hypothetical protein